MLRKTLSTALLAAAIAALCAPAAGFAQEGIKGFERIGSFVLEVAGEPVPGARIFQAKEPPALLVDSSKLPAPVLIRVRERTVQTVQLLKLAEQANGTLDLLPGAAGAAQPPFEVEGVTEGIKVLFSVDGVSAVLKPKPYLLGLHETADMKSYSPEYERKANAYQPSEPILEKLRAEGREVRVRVFFGTWCPACGEMVPRIMRVAEALQGSNLAVEYYGLPRGFDGEPEATRYDIHSVPTGVVFVDGEEVGRIQGNGWRLPELALTNLLQGS